ncbi:MAG: DUF4276 family protein [Planctomycetota bacterium]|jgi:hypothetical protein|nr:DUF4276 family protein [Planctomycetota bacterium]
MNLVFFLEEPSAEALLKELLPTLIVGKNVNVHYYKFQGKQDLDKNLARRLRYWQEPDTAFIILRDQDANDCRVVKRKLNALCKSSDKRYLIRIACRELESFYFGDLTAVEQALAVKVAHFSRKRRYRESDNIINPAGELTRITNGKYQKIAGSRTIGKILRSRVAANTSPSFHALIDGIRKIITGGAT